MSQPDDLVSIRVKFPSDSRELQARCLDLVRQMGGRTGLALVGEAQTSFLVPKARKLEAQAALNRLVAGGVDGLPTTLHGWLQAAIEQTQDVPCERVGLVFTSNGAVSMGLFSIHQDQEGPLDLAGLLSYATTACVNNVRAQLAQGARRG